MKRPRPPAHLHNGDGDDERGEKYVPAPELATWLIETFVTDSAPLVNEDHAHLREATLGVLWSTVPQFRHGRRIVGQTHLGRSAPASTKWYQSRFEQQTIEWFGCIPDFVLTFDVDYAINASDPVWCALVEHELYHAAQAHDENGPRFNAHTGLPSYTLRAHDVEEFLGVVRRYGPVTDELKAMCELAADRPTFLAADVQGVCGNCA